MKFNSYLLLLLISLITVSCTDTLTEMGSKIQPEGDKIIVDTATLNMNSENIIVPFMYSRPDSLMLGTFVDYTYGTTYADILTQLQPPVDFSFPANAVADSAKLIMYYYSWFGDKYSPMEVNIYEMNKGKTFDFTGLYRSDINVNEYSDKNIKLGGRIFTVKDAVVTRPDTFAIEFPLSQNFVQRFSPELKKRYTDDTVKDFHKTFNGIYITTDFGSASMLYIRTILMRYYFHYTYTTKKTDGVTDSVVVVKTYMNYPANEEVRQINRFQHPDISKTKQNFDATPEINAVSAPANIYTKINMPFGKLKAKTNVNGKKRLINRAVMRVDVAEIDKSKLAQPIPSSMLLIKESEYEDFFSKRELPTDSTAILTSISYETDEDTDEIIYYYSFDMAKMITKELNNADSDENINFILVPVSLLYDGNKSIIEVKPQNLMRAVKICSGTHSKRPMKLNVVYSGF